MYKNTADNEEKILVDKNIKQWYNDKAVERERKNLERGRFWTSGNKSAEVFLKRVKKTLDKTVWKWYND